MRSRLLAVALLATLPAPPLAAAPRPLSGAEEAALVLAARYLSAGPDGWWELLAEEAPLRTLGRERANTEIELRAGPAPGATWRLATLPASAGEGTVAFTVEHPSGIRDVLFLRLRQAPDGWRLVELRNLADPRIATASGRTDGGSAVGVRPPPPGPTARRLWLPGAALAAAALTLALRSRGRWGAGAAAACVALAVGCGGGLSTPPGRTDDARAAPGIAPGEALDELLRLHRQLASGEPPSALPELPPDDLGRARAWLAQRRLADLDLRGAAALLRDFPPRPDAPLVTLLRARLAALGWDDVGTALAYQELFAGELHVDSLLFEGARALDTLGFAERAEGLYDELEEMGSREAELYYELARRKVVAGTLEAASRHFETAFALEPMLRLRVVADPALAYLVGGSRQARRRVELGAVKEPEVRCASSGARRVALDGASAVARIGALLVVEAGSGRLEVPGACDLQLPGATVYDAGDWARREDERLLAEVRPPSGAGVAAAPPPRHRLEQAVGVLAARGRWEEIDALTAGLEPTTAAPSTVRYRAEALRRAGRTEESRRLLVDLARDNERSKRPDPATLFRLAELLVADREYDLALRLMTKAYTSLPFDVEPQRLLQLKMEKRLATSPILYETEHFRVYYPTERSFYFAKRAAEILEAEKKRLRRWIPAEPTERIDVYLLEVSEFRAGYGGGIDVVGLFDGKIRLPFGEVKRFHPVLVSILTHELAHALLTQATDDRAPHWFQEGLAQHVEMVPGGVNPIPGYRDSSTLLSFPMIDAVLDGFVSPHLVPLAYDEAKWTLHYIEARHGLGSIHRLQDAFRRGLDTEQALEQVLSTSLADFDARLWSWCATEAPQYWPTEVVDYENGV